MAPSSQINVAILGASGYTGAETIRLLLKHPHVHIAALTAESNAGKPLAEVYPHLAYHKLPDLVALGAVDYSKIDVVFCCLPHGATEAVVKQLPEHLKVIDLSADFRWKENVTYGLTEIYRGQVSRAHFVANPGCYPTSAQLPLIPLLKARLIKQHGIIIDSKSGVSGAGRSAKQANLFTEIDGGFSAYAVGTHRHTPEIEKGLSLAAGKPVVVSFTPHLVPMPRGILSTIYVQLEGSASADDLRAALIKAYKDEPFVHVAPAGVAPSTHQVRGTNHNIIGVFADHAPGRAILVSVIDNLVKGASGQAVQNLNAMMGWPETLGLEETALFP